MCVHEGGLVAVEAPSDVATWLLEWLDALESSDPDLVTPTSTEVDSAEAIPGSMSSLLDLFELFDRAHLDLDENLVALSGDRHELVRLLLYRRFVAELRQVVTKLRPRYVEREDVVLSPRGRIDDRSLVVALASSRPDVLCRFDEHSVVTDLATVLLAADRVVARYGGTRRSADLFSPVRDEAIRLSRALAGVPVLDRSVAIRRARSLRLSRLESEFEGVLVLGVQVLRDDAQMPTAGHPEASSFRLAVPTDKLWEHVLEQMFLRVPTVAHTSFSAGNKAGAQATDVPAPWTMSGRKPSPDRFPDFLLRTSAPAKPQVWCLDAKYKSLPNGMPAADDANQMFVYSHLAQLEGDHVDRCALIYPHRDVLGVIRTLYRERRRVVPLDLVAAPFPQPVDLRGDHAWETFLLRGAAVLGAVL